MTNLMSGQINAAAVATFLEESKHLDADQCRKAADYFGETIARHGQRKGADYVATLTAMADGLLARCNA